MNHSEWIVILATVIYAVIGGLIVIDVWFDFKLSIKIRKFFKR